MNHNNSVANLSFESPGEPRRVRLRELTEDDAPFILKLLNDPGFLQHIGDRKARTTADAAAYIRRSAIASYEKNGFGLNCIIRISDGEPVGICGLIRRDALEHVDLGFALLAEFAGHGYALEAARSSMAEAVGKHGFTTVAAIVSPENARSIRLLQKLGFQPERDLTLPGETKLLHLLLWRAV